MPDEAPEAAFGPDDVQRATLNLLEDFEAEKRASDATRRATFNILEDFDVEKQRTHDLQRATFNILDDFEEEKARIQDVQRATFNILEDLNAEKAKLEAVERSLEQRAAELGRSNAELQQFAYVASHDLQEPLRTVNGAMSRIAKRMEGTLDAETQEYFRFALAGTARMRLLIMDLLAYSRVGTHAAPLVPMPMEAVADDVLRTLHGAIEDAKATVTRDPLPNVVGDASQLAQVLQNLVGNALKFRGDAPPAIHLGCRRDGALWRFEVRDNGIGIAPEYQAKLFVIFQRLHQQDKYPGTGIGLAITKKIVERHGGRVGIESAAGKGATFWFTLRGAGPA